MLKIPQKQLRTYDLLKAEIKQKYFFRIIAVSLWPSSSIHLNPLDDAIYGVLGNKSNTTSNPNIGSLKTAIEKE